MTGQTISHYQVLEKLGEGGMGVVYKARDTHLDRFVAIKVLPPERVADPERKRRFVQEAKAASALNHPNIIIIYDIDQAEVGQAGYPLGGPATPGGPQGPPHLIVDFIAMEYVPGKTLGQLIPRNGMPLGEALKCAVETADALGRAHAAGIIHRDLKPSNIMVDEHGLLKLLDFGLAKLTEAAPAGEAAEAETETAGEPSLTKTGTILGTVAYMSPEQVEGKKLDARSDVFSFGAVLYEMLTGRRAFRGDSQISTMPAILRDSPQPVKKLRPEAPAELERILLRCLEKNPGARYRSGAELHKDLLACHSQSAASEVRLRHVLRRPKVAIGALAVLLMVLAGTGWLGMRLYRVLWARSVALPEIASLVDKNNYTAAFRLARKVDRYVPNDDELKRVRSEIWTPISIYTEPPGADIFIRDYAGDSNDWELLGKSPVEKLRLPPGNFCIKIVKPGYQPVEGTFDQFVRNFQRTLQPQGTAPPGMIFVPAGTLSSPSGATYKAEAFWLDKYEVTNRQFKEFADRGGYRKREYWKEPFVEKGSTISWDSAMTRFRDATGQAGPATWELGVFPEGKGDHPVGGVCWFEAAAYADFTGKSLPTIYHWRFAAGFLNFSDILRLSNFDGEGPVPVGRYPGLGPYGSYDMAGNVSEWCWNRTTGDRRFVSGGAWSDPNYMFRDLDAASPFDRSATRGFRCAKYVGALPDTLTRPLDIPARDRGRDKPVTDEVFRFYRSIYSYDPGDLKARVESVDDTSPWWRREKVSFQAAYGDERVIAYLFLPRNATPPYQTVVYFPGSGARRETTSTNLELRRVDFLVRSGRAVVYPIYKATYERNVSSAATGPNAERDLVVQWSKDIGRSLDYLETRMDIDRGRIAYLGVSLGARLGTIFTAIESRFRTCVLQSGGFSRVSDQTTKPAEIDEINFAPRVKMPVLMMNGRDDFIFPPEECQRPMFRLLGASENDKRYLLFDCGHALPRTGVIKEILEWLNRHLGPVKTP